MAGINPISGGISPIRPATASAVGTQRPSAGKAGFGEMLKGCIDKVNADQQASSVAIRDLVAGKTDDVLPVVSAAAKADMSFKLLLGVRNKVIEAYKQTLNMQV